MRRALVLGLALALSGCVGIAGDRVDSGQPEDAGATDAGATDAGAMDGGAGDAGATDAGAVDGGPDDAGAMDAGGMDGGAGDAGATDAGAMDGGAGDAGATDAGATDAGATDAGTADGGLFPLSIAPGGRYLVDASGRPFLVHGEAAWSLIAELTNPEVDVYLDDRAARGINTLLVSLVEHQFSSNPPADAYGDQPFTPAGNFAGPNEPYFAHADEVIRRAKQRGMLVMLTFAYLGYGGGSEGWYQELSAMTPAQLRGYGQYVANRYKDFGNVLWVAGGDYEPANKDVVRNLVQGIRDVDSTQLMAFHGSRGVSALTFWAGDTWIDVNDTYVGSDVAGPSDLAYSGSTKPYFLIEGLYENESGNRQSLRAEGYITMTHGGAGRLIGNAPLWCFGRTNCFNPSGAPNWQNQLNSPGSRDMTVFKTFFSGLPWYRCVPAPTLTTAGTDHVCLTTDGTLAVLYFSGQGSATVDLSRFSVATRPSWVDPSSGALQSAGGTLGTSGTQGFTTPGTNASGGSDWVLLLDGR